MQKVVTYLEERIDPLPQQKWREKMGKLRSRTASTKEKERATNYVRILTSD
jgi:hypothetical protein